MNEIGPDNLLDMIGKDSGDVGGKISDEQANALDVIAEAFENKSPKSSKYLESLISGVKIATEEGSDVLLDYDMSLKAVETCLMRDRLDKEKIDDVLEAVKTLFPKGAD